jgi:pseudomonalisin
MTQGGLSHRGKAAAVVSLLAMGFAFSTTPANAVTGWATTATSAERLVAATDLGSEAASTPLHVALALNLRDASGLRDLISRGSVISPAQFLAGYSPTAAQAQSVASYLADEGFSHVKIAGNRMLVSADGTVGRATAAFGTTIERFRQNGRVVYANQTAARVPAALGGVVAAVLGLNNAGVMHAGPKIAADPPSSCLITGVGVPCEYAPQGFWRAYNAANAPTGAATSVAIFAEGDLTGVVQDLRTEETATGLPQVPVTIVPTGPATSDTSGVDEWDMDTQFSTGMAGTVQNLYLYDAPSLDNASLTEAFNQFATQNVAKAASASFGECEFAASLDGSMLADDNAFM